MLVILENNLNLLTLLLISLFLPFPRGHARNNKNVLRKIFENTSFLNTDNFKECQIKLRIFLLYLVEVEVLEDLESRDVLRG